MKNKSTDYKMYFNLLCKFWLLKNKYGAPSVKKIQIPKSWEIKGNQKSNNFQYPWFLLTFPHHFSQSVLPEEMLAVPQEKAVIGFLRTVADC